MANVKKFIIDDQEIGIPSGGSEEWELITHDKLTESTTIIHKDFGNKYKKIYVEMKCVNGGTATNVGLKVIPNAGGNTTRHLFFGTTANATKYSVFELERITNYFTWKGVTGSSSIPASFDLGAQSKGATLGNVGWGSHILDLPNDFDGFTGIEFTDITFNVDTEFYIYGIKA